ncbi:ImpA family metalloprotease [Photobacterium sp. SDRW27]|uniref:ImpA family metalloprotease n=1 Tax=Photobacterium obscurum TaxID=2829490 RepID=UPI002244672C|nr:ImpA family metalloprotease [Photobacterium obscurum]MCW8329462.1 ImpA family metalloprotease [Photobacterium obscurum]
MSYQRIVMLGLISSLAACGGDSSSGNENSGVNGGNLSPGTTLPVFYKVSAQNSVGGTITPQIQEVKQGQSYTFTVLPERGFTTQSVSGCNGTLDGQNYTTGEVTQDCQITARFITNAQSAVDQEDHTLASAEELIKFSQSYLKHIDLDRRTLVDTLYQNVGSLISWHPSHDSITFSTFMPENTFPVLRSTKDGGDSPSSEGLVFAGQQGEHRYAAMSANMFSVDRSAETDQLLKNLINWLIDSDDSTYQLKIVTSHVPSKADSWYFPHNENIRSWLTSHYPDQHMINTANSCDYEALSTCIDEQQPDLIVFSDIDRRSRGYEAVSAAIEKAKSLQIPILVTNYYREASHMAVPLYRYMGLQTKGNYWSKHHADKLAVEDLKTSDPTLQQVELLLTRLSKGEFDITALEQCNKNFIYCTDPAFQSAFKTAADWYRNTSIAFDSYNLNPFDTGYYPVARAGLLLADKYRSAIDYPIGQSEPTAWQQAMFADWVVSYTREHNLAQPDLGEYVVDRSQVAKGSNAHYAYPPTVTESQVISVPYSKQWTTTGWYALPGQTITVNRTDNSDATVAIKLNYHRSNTNRAYQQKIYRGPLELAQQRIQVNAGETVTFSTPYGGPIYVYLEGSGSPVQTALTAAGVVKHPAIMDFSDPAEILRFNQAIDSTELPHVDLRTDGAEQHLRRDRFLNAIGDDVPTVNALLKSIEEDHINSVYTLAGYKIQGKSLAESLPDDVKAVCSKLFGQADCFNESFHTRTIIQHANYDQNAQCGSGCSGNPWDASWNISPTGWGDNHELGHNLQTNRLNVQYAEAADADDWTKYGSRAGENSNNIFPYYVKWKAHYLRDGNTTTITDGHMNHKDLFYVFMSDAAQIKDGSDNRVVVGSSCNVMDEGADRFIVPWKSNAYATHNGYRMAFYIQMALRVDQQPMVTGDKLENGFNVFTLLYLHNRIFGHYAANETDWLNNRERLGFSLFPYDGHAVFGGKNIRSIPGNDFMLVALSVITNRDWRPYFDMFGLRYSSLAESQVVANAKGGGVATGMYVLEKDLPPANMSAGLDFLNMSLNDGTTLWPRDNSSPRNCSL